MNTGNRESNPQTLPLSLVVPFLSEKYLPHKTKTSQNLSVSGCFSKAEREGFEPSRRYQRLHDFQSCAFDQLSHLSTW